MDVLSEIRRSVRWAGLAVCGAALLTAGCMGVSAVPSRTGLCVGHSRDGKLLLSKIADVDCPELARRIELLAANAQEITREDDVHTERRDCYAVLEADGRVVRIVAFNFSMGAAMPVRFSNAKTCSFGYMVFDLSVLRLERVSYDLSFVSRVRSLFWEKVSQLPPRNNE